MGLSDRDYYRERRVKPSIKNKGKKPPNFWFILIVLLLIFFLWCFFELVLFYS